MPDALSRAQADTRMTPAPDLSPEQRHERAQVFDDAARDIHQRIRTQPAWLRVREFALHLAAAYEGCARAERREARQST